MLPARGCWHTTHYWLATCTLANSTVRIGMYREASRFLGLSLLGTSGSPPRTTETLPPRDRTHSCTCLSWHSAVADTHKRGSCHIRFFEVMWRANKTRNKYMGTSFPGTVNTAWLWKMSFQSTGPMIPLPASSWFVHSQPPHYWNRVLWNPTHCQ